MSEQRDRLLARFRAVLLSRVESVHAALSGGSLDESQLGELLRDLHTLKGESTMLGLSTLATAFHLLEERVEALGGPAGEARDRALASARQVLGAILGVLGGELDADQAEGTLSALCRGLLRSSTPPDVETPQVADPTERDDLPRRRGKGWTHVDARLIDTLCEKVAELSLALSALRRRQGALLERAEVPAADRIAVRQDFEHCRLLLDGCAAMAWRLRLVPFEPTLRELARHVDELGRASGKELRVEVRAAGVQLESDVLDRLWEPLLHLGRNAVDHGIEAPAERGGKPGEGTIAIEASSNGPSILVTVSDDGRGIDVALVRDLASARGLIDAEDAARVSDEEVLELLFRRGFSTRNTVGSVSGRGVGLDVVRDQIEAIGGEVRLESKVGQGTRFVLSVPAAITKERIVVVESAGLLFGFAARHVRGVVALDTAAADATAPEFRMLRFQEAQLPLRSLAGVLGEQGLEPFALILDIGVRRYALAVARVLGEESLIRTPADPLVLETSVFGATASFEDGRLVLLPHLDRLGRLLQAAAAVRPAARSEARRRRRVLIADDSPVIRNLVAEILSSVGLEVLVSRDGAEALSALEREVVDLVLSDIEMPNLNGFELVEQIRRRSRELPIIVLSTRGSTEDRRRAAALGADAYLVKSNFEGGSLLDAVRRFVDLPS